MAKPVNEPVRPTTLLMRSEFLAAALLPQSLNLIVAIFMTSRFIEAAVTRGWRLRQAELTPKIGIDENTFGRREYHITEMTDIDRLQVLEVVPKRTISAWGALWEKLTLQQRGSVHLVAFAMLSG